jgi:iron complex transport system substrate-binding protein
MEVRIVSLTAWGTQVLLDLDLDHWIAGCSHDALIPPEVRTEIPVITRPFDPSALPKENLSLSGMLLSAWDVDMESLRKLKPSHIITEGVLHLSGLTQEEAEEILERDGLPGCRLLDFYPVTVDDILSGISQIAQIFGNEKKGAELVEECLRKLKRTSRKYGIKRNPPVVAVIRNWPNVEMSGRWMSDLISMLRAIPAVRGDDIFIHPDTYFEEQPDIFVAGNPFASLEENRKKAETLEKEKLLSVFACEKTPSFVVVDGPVFYDHSCTGLDTALKILGEIMKNDPDFSERKEVYWDFADKCAG